MAIERNEGLPLREHQVDMVSDFEDFLFSGKRGGHIIGAPGVGKSAVLVKIAQIFSEISDKKIVLLSPTTPILANNRTAAEDFTPDLDITNFYGGERNLSGQVINTTYQSMVGILGRIALGRSVVDKNGHEFKADEVGLVICDELHTGLGEIRFDTIYRNLPGAKFVGGTGTAYFGQLEGFKRRGLITGNEPWLELFTNLIHELTMEEAIERGILTHLDIRLLRTTTQVDNLRVMANGEISSSDLEKYFGTETRAALGIAALTGVDNIPAGVSLPASLIEELDQIHRDIKGKPSLLFGSSVAQIEKRAVTLAGLGLRVETIHGRKPDNLGTMRSFNSGELDVLLGVDLLRLGVDLPRVEAVYLERPTASGVVLAQEIGRGMRNSPETGKEKVIVIQPVDLIKRGAQPLLVPYLFSSNFILRGSQTGADESRRGYFKRAQPLISFSGIGINFVLEQAKSQELIGKRFEGASVQAISELMDQITEEIRASNPDLSLYHLMSEVASRIPGKVSADAQNIAISAIEDPDKEVQQAGKKALMLLNLKTLISVVDSFFAPDEEISEKHSELLATAIAEFYSIDTKDLEIPYYVSVRIHHIVKRGITKSIKDMEDIATAIGNQANSRGALSELANSGLAYLTEQEKDAAVSEVMDIYFPSNRSLSLALHEHLAVLGTTRYPLPAAAGIFGVEAHEDEKEVMERLLEDDVEEIMKGHLAPRLSGVIRMRFGLDDGVARGLVEVADEMKISRERVRQLELEAIINLREMSHPSIKAKLLWYLEPDEAERLAEGTIKWTDKRPLPVEIPLSIFNPDYKVVTKEEYFRNKELANQRVLAEAGINSIGELLVTALDSYKMKSLLKKTDFAAATGSVLRRLMKLNLSSVDLTDGESAFLIEITDPIITAISQTRDSGLSNMLTQEQRGAVLGRNAKLLPDENLWDRISSPEVLFQARQELAKGYLRLLYSYF